MLDELDYAYLTRVQNRELKREQREALRQRVQLARDPIVAFMRTLICSGCGRPVTQCTCRDEDLPFADPREVRE